MILIPPVKADWAAKCEADLKGKPVAKLVSRLYEGVQVEPLYTQDDACGDDERAALLTSTTIVGIFAKPWLQPDRAKANDQAINDLMGGVKSLRLLWPSAMQQNGRELDPANDAADGVVIENLGNLAEVLEGVDLTIAPIELDAGWSTPAAAAAFFALCEQRGIAKADIVASLGFDPIGNIAASGQSPKEAAAAVADALRWADWCATEAPKVTALRLSSAAYHEAGADAVEEIAVLAASVVHVLQQCEQPAQVVHQIALSMPVGCDQFLEIAKIRAMRQVWSRIIEASELGAVPAKVSATTSQRMLTRRDPWVNMLRTTVAGFAAAVGGADTIGIDAFDAALGASDDFARRIARNIQVILDEESHLGEVIDPAGGAWYVEQLTADLAQKAWARFQDILAAGGIINILEDGSLAERIEQVAAQRRKDLAKRKAPITGISEFPHIGEEAVERPAADLASLRSTSNAAVVLGDDAIADSIAAANAGPALLTSPKLGPGRVSRS